MTLKPVTAIKTEMNLSVTMCGIEFMARRGNRNAELFALSFQLPQIISGLCAQPRFGTFAEYHFEAQCHFSRYARFAINQFTQTFARHVQIFRGLCDAQTKRFKPQFLQHFTRMRGVKLFHRFALVVIQVIDDINIAILKSKAHTPICLNSDHPQFGFLSFQRMQTQRGGIDVIKTLSIVEHRQNQAQFFSMNRLNASLIACRIELFQAFVCETFNHGLDCNLTGFKITLTHPHTPAKMTPYCKSSRGRGNPFSNGDRTPQIKAVFLCLSFFQHAGLHIMMGLLGQSLRLVAPLRGISTPCNSVANTVESICGGYSILSNGITA